MADRELARRAQRDSTLLLMHGGPGSFEVHAIFMVTHNLLRGRVGRVRRFTVRLRGVEADVVSDVFGLRCEVVPDPVCGTPMIVPRGRHHAEGLTPELAP
jgi:hypothetical protein